MDALADTQFYVRLISGTILGLTMGKLLSGTAKFIQHPMHYRINILHALWIAFLFGAIIVFWWQEGLTFGRVAWSFPLYAFQVAYCGTFLFIAAILLPDEVTDHETHYDYLIDRRYWFYGALILSYLLGIGNELVKGGWDDIFVDPAYILTNLVLVAILASGMVINRRRVHIGIAALFAAMVAGAILLE